MSGKLMISQIPIKTSALEQSSNFKDWLLRVTDETLEFLEKKDLFSRGHDHTSGKKDKRDFSEYTLSLDILCGHKNLSLLMYALKKSERP